jgi:hypothetical protein
MTPTQPTSGAPVAHRWTRLRAAGRRVLVILAAPLLFILFGCDRPPTDADRILDQLAAQKIYTDAPPGGAVLLAEGRDKGLASTVANRDPSVARVYSVAQPVDEIVAYYRRTYPEYHWHTDSYYPAPATHGFELVSTSGSIGVDVYVGGQPFIPQYPAITPSQAPTGHGTYVTVYLSAASHT